MISLSKLLSFCKDDIKLIQNYEQAIRSNKMWVCHHRDEIKKLPSGIIVIRSEEYLQENDRYFKCPANELILLPDTIHRMLHGHCISKETRDKLSKARKGKKRKPMKEELKERLSTLWKGKHWHLENGKRVWEVSNA